MKKEEKNGNKIDKGNKYIINKNEDSKYIKNYFEYNYNNYYYDNNNYYSKYKNYNNKNFKKKKKLNVDNNEYYKSNYNNYNILKKKI